VADVKRLDAEYWTAERRNAEPVWRLLTGAIWRRRYGLLAVVFLGLPTWLAIAYFAGIATPQYETEARYVVKSAARPPLQSGLSMLASLGLGRSQDDSYAVQDFIRSRDAIARLRPQLPLEKIYGADHADFLARFPSMLFGNSEEEFYWYFQHVVSVLHSPTTGVTTLKVRAFTAGEARDIARALLAQGEELVNRMNVRARKDAIQTAQTELEHGQQRLIDAQLELTGFRNRELTIDPTRNAATLGELIAQLSAELATTRAQVRELSIGSGASPQMAGLRRKITALEEQIAQERDRIGRDAGGLAGRIAVYERLSLERDFAEKRVAAAEAELVRAREEASRQQLYLERVVEPSLPDHPTQPERVRLIVMMFFANLLLLLIGWLVYSGVREHVAR
jgi:capsular polysaccharide transport system permease protein